MFKQSLIPAVLAAGISTAALAAPELSGAWSTSMPGQGGMAQVTEAFDRDGHFVMVRREPNGTLLRMWGDYRSAPISSNAVRVEARLQGWAPHQICAQAPGLTPHCSAFTPPPLQPAVYEFLAPDVFRVNGLVVQRESNPGLLAQPVADRLVLAAPAPIQPAPATGGVAAPHLTPYVTPHDPSAGNHGSDLQRRRICSINGGSLVVVGGLTCVNGIRTRHRQAGPVATGPARNGAVQRYRVGVRTLSTTAKIRGAPMIQRGSAQWNQALSMTFSKIPTIDHGPNR